MGILINDLIEQVLEAVDDYSLRIKKISKGFRFTGTMLEDGSCGMCFSIFNQESINSCDYIRSIKSPEHLNFIKLIQFAKNLRDDLERIIGISVLNAASQHILKRTMENYQISFDTDPIDHIKFEITDRVVMIGAIGNFLLKLQKLVNDVVVIDDKLKNTNFPNIKNPETTQKYLEKADIVLITGSSIVNNTLESLLKGIKNAREIAVVGPSAGFLPESLFNRGVTILSGMQVLEPYKVLQIISENGGTPHFKNYCKKYNIIR